MLRLGLLLLQKVDDEVLVLLYEVIREALLFQIIAKMFPPLGIKRFENGKLGPVTIGAPRGLPVERPDGRGPVAGGLGRRRRWCRGVPMSSKDAAQQAVFVVTACAGSHSSEWCRPGGFTRVLLPVIHLLLELLRLLFVNEG